MKKLLFITVRFAAESWKDGEVGMNFCCENCEWSEIVGSQIMCNYSRHRTWFDKCCEAWKPEEEEIKVVRCKDCKHLFDSEHTENCCDVLMEKAGWLKEISVSTDWFCADGERR